VVWIGLIVLTAFALGPFLWMLLTSLKSRTELYATPLQYLPVHPTFENYVEAWTSSVTPFSRFFLNSLWVCSVTMVATTAVSVLAGYAIARFRFAGRDALLLIFLATQMFPSVLLIAPLLTQWRALGLIDTYQALIYSNFSFTVPFTVWMMVGYFSSIPRDLEESASLDGASRFGIFFTIALPLARPGLVGLLVLFALIAGSGLMPPVWALVILTVPPLLAGTYAGISSVDANVVDAARAMGMKELQVLFGVEVPNGLLVMFGGIRTAVLQVIATVSVVAYLPLGGLGRYLFDGLVLQDFPRMLAGSLLIAALAIVVDLVLAAVQRLVVSPGLSARSKGGRKAATDLTAAAPAAAAVQGGTA